MWLQSALEGVSFASRLVVGELGTVSALKIPLWCIACTSPISPKLQPGLVFWACFFRTAKPQTNIMLLWFCIPMEELVNYRNKISYDIRAGNSQELSPRQLFEINPVGENSKQRHCAGSHRHFILRNIFDQRCQRFETLTQVYLDN